MLTINYCFKLAIFFCGIPVAFVNVENNPKYEALTIHRVLSRPKRIINGENVKNSGLYPFFGTLNSFNSDYNFITCGAILIGPQWILTAAHCIDKDPLRLEVLFGDFRFNHAHKYRISTTFFIHEDWSTTKFQNDIGLVKLSKSVILNEYVNIIQIVSDKSTFEGQNGTILGYGITEFGEQSEKLRRVNVTIMSNEECRVIMYDPNKTITDSHICTDGSGGKGFCSGDSGGPLIVGNVLVGLASFTMSNCTSGLPSVFTRVSTYLQWINKTIFNESFPQNVNICITTPKMYYLLLGIIFFETITLLLLFLRWLYQTCKKPQSSNHEENNPEFNETQNTEELKRLQ